MFIVLKMEWIRKNLLFRYRKSSEVVKEKETEKIKGDDGEFIDIVGEEKEDEVLDSTSNDPLVEDVVIDEFPDLAYFAAIYNFDSSIFEPLSPPAESSGLEPIQQLPRTKSANQHQYLNKKKIAVRQNPPSQLKNNIIHQPK